MTELIRHELESRVVDRDVDNLERDAGGPKAAARHRAANAGRTSRIDRDARHQCRRKFRMSGLHTCSFAASNAAIARSSYRTLRPNFL